TLDMAWVIERREKLARQYENLLADMGHLQQRKGHHDAALGFFMRTLREAPQREDIYRDIMTTYATLGRKSDALRQFDILVKYLDDSIGLPPSRKSRDLYEQIKHQPEDGA
ncbi:MAG: bacterial transcriptional activator domain-containing protein, partial [Aggregatilineales bacterium]